MIRQDLGHAHSHTVRVARPRPGGRVRSELLGREGNGAYDPLERLDALRKVFYPVPGLALGGGFKQVLAQSEEVGFSKFVENQI